MTFQRRQRIRSILGLGAALSLKADLDELGRVKSDQLPEPPDVDEAVSEHNLNNAAHAELFSAKANSAHTHSQSDVTGLVATLEALVAELTVKADLINGKIPTSQLPPVAISEFLGRADDESEMLLLVGERGDYCYRTDLEAAVWLITDDPTVVESWLVVALPTVSVQSINEQTGHVILGASDVGAVPSARQVTTGTGLSGGGDLSANRTITIDFDAVAAKVHAHVMSDVEGLVNALLAKAGLADANTWPQNQVFNGRVGIRRAVPACMLDISAGSDIAANVIDVVASLKNSYPAGDVSKYTFGKLGLGVTVDHVLLGGGATAVNNSPGTFTVENRQNNGTYVETLRVNPAGNLDTAGNTWRLMGKRTPASATATGLQGESCYDNNYEYRCTVDNKWERLPYPRYAAFSVGSTPIDNWTPTPATCYRAQASAATATITGADIAGNWPGTYFRLYRATSGGTLTIKHQSAASLAANRFFCETEEDVVVGPFESVEVFYDSSISRWRTFKI